MNTGMIGLRTSIENPQTVGEKSAGPGAVELPRDRRSAAAGAGIENLSGLLKARDTAGHEEDSPAKLTQAAQEFESLLLAQILRSVREAGSGGWLGSGESQEMSSTMELAETQLARALAQGGALGITKLLAGELPPDSPREAGSQQPEAAVESRPARLVRGVR
jgi:Rod binding domain-containing protein